MFRMRRINTDSTLYYVRKDEQIDSENAKTNKGAK